MFFVLWVMVQFQEAHVALVSFTKLVFYQVLLQRAQTNMKPSLVGKALLRHARLCPEHIGEHAVLVVTLRLLVNCAPF